MNLNKIHKLIVLGGTLLVLLGLMQNQAHAIQFVDMTRDTAWQCQPLEVSFCKCHKGNELTPSEIWVGLCKNDLPQGKGYLIDKNIALLRLANNGRIINAQGAVNISGLEALTNHKTFWSGYSAVIHSPKELRKGPSQSAISLNGHNFLALHGQHAPEALKQKVKELMNADRLQQIESGYEAALSSGSQTQISRYLQWWGSDITDQQKSRLESHSNMLQARTAENQARAERNAKAEAERRNYMRQHACNQFYSGYVGKYTVSGLLGTSSSDYVVRYVNPQHNQVTIEGRSSGLVLKFGEMRELSCFDLWERSQ